MISRFPRRTTWGRPKCSATQVCYTKSMPPSVTSSFRMSKELQRVLSDAAARTGKGKNAIIIEALVKYLNAMERESLAEEARRQSELVSRNEQDAAWNGMADPSLPGPSGAADRLCQVRDRPAAATQGD